MAMAEPYSNINFRLPVPLRREVEQAAAENERSLGREVLYRLQQSFQGDHKRRRRRARKTVPAMPAGRVAAP
jgi:Arc-like DNA binding dprotein